MIALPSTPPAARPLPPAAPDEPVTVSRAQLQLVLAHLAAEQERFPTRRLRQALKLLRRMLGELPQGG